MWTKLREYVLRKAIQGMIDRVVFDDDSYIIELHLKSGTVLITQGDKNKWEVEKLFDEMNIKV